MTDPDQIRADIERTRANLSSDVNALTESVKPSNVAGRQVDKARSAVVGVKDKVMGVTGNATSAVSSTASGVSSSVSDTASTVSDAVTGAPHRQVSGSR
jgi:phage-related protein